MADGCTERLRARDRLQSAGVPCHLGHVCRSSDRWPRNPRAGNTSDAAAHHAADAGVGEPAGDLGHAVGLLEGRGRQQRDCESAERRRQALSGCDLELTGQVAGRAGLQVGWVYQQPEPRRTSADVGRESDLRRHARRIGVLQLSRQQRSQVSRNDRAEARWLADVRSLRAWVPTRTLRTFRR